VRLVLSGVAALFLIGSGYIALRFVSDMRAHRARIGGVATVVSSPFGDLEYIAGGEGPPVLVVHGAGGGFDQGELIARVVLGDGFRYVAPSRLGYLGSANDGPASYDDQALALAWLLDHLGIEEAGVVALSQGGPAALLLAALHPEKVSSLVLLSAGVTPVTVEDQAAADARGNALVRLYRYDLTYWLVTRLFRRRVMSLMGADDEVIAALTEEERGWVEAVIEEMNPASLRYHGVVGDNRNPLPGDRIAAIRAPTLIVHATDDRLQLFENAAFAAETIPGARLVRFDRGGHFVMIVEREAVREAVRAHLLEPRVGGD
jgi:2-hydroxy-6-oxonona-2,4-dienedioate hydrolase